MNEEDVDVVSLVWLIAKGAREIHAQLVADRNEQDRDGELF